MAGEITVTELQNAALDAASLSTFINGADTVDVTTREGQVYPTVAKLVADTQATFTSVETTASANFATVEQDFRDAINDLVGTQTSDYDVRIIGSFAGLSALTIPGNVQVVVCMGYTSPFDRGMIVLERYVSEPYMPARFRTTSNSGTVHWGILPHEPQFRVSSGGALSGLTTDSADIVQDFFNLIDGHNPDPNGPKYSLPLFLDRNELRWDSRIHMGWGNAFQQFRMYGLGAKYRSGVSTMHGTTYVQFTPATGFAIGISGARKSWISGFFCEGAVNSAISTLVGSAAIGQPVANRRAIADLATWQAVADDGRYNPYACIVIDPYLNDHIFTFDGGDGSISLTGTNTVDFTQLTAPGEDLTIANTRYTYSSNTVNFDGTYTVLTVTSDKITLANPGATNSAWTDLETATSAPTGATYAKLTSSSGNVFIGAAINGDYSEPTVPQYIHDTVGHTFVPHRDMVGGGSAVDVDDVSCGGFGTYVCSQPGNADRNGDFLKVSRALVENCINAFSIGNSQSRDVNLSLINFNRIHTFVTNKRHGRQVGQFGGEITDCSGGGFVARMFEINTTAFFKTGVFRNCFCESLLRLGDVDGGTSNERQLIFDNCTWNFRTRLTEWGSPANFADFGSVDVKFVGGEITSAYQGVFPMVSGNIVFDNTTVQGDRQSGTLPRWEAMGHNALAGGLVIDTTPRNTKQNILYKKWNTTTGVFTGQTVTMNDDILCNRTYGTPYWQHEVRRPDVSTNIRVAFNEPKSVTRNTTNAGHITAITRRTNSDVWDVTLAGIQNRDEQANYDFHMAGDVAVWEGNGTTMFCRHRDGLDRVWVQQNNLIDDGSGNLEGYDTALDDIQSTASPQTSANFRFLTGRFYTLREKVHGVMTINSSKIINLRCKSNSTTFLNTAVAVGDWLSTDTHGLFGELRLMEAADGEVAAVTGASGSDGTITFSDEPVDVPPNGLAVLEWFMIGDIPNGDP